MSCLSPALIYTHYVSPSFNMVRRAYTELDRLALSIIKKVAEQCVAVLYGAWRGALHFFTVSFPILILSIPIAEYFTEAGDFEKFSYLAKNLGSVADKVSLTSVVFLVPAVEEVIFRGALEPAIGFLAKKVCSHMQWGDLETSKKVARIGSSVLFGAAHLLNGTAYSVIQAITAGLSAFFVLSPLKEEYGLISSIAAHSMNNFLAVF